MDPSFRRAGIVALFALALDQMTKVIARAQLDPRESVELFAGVSFRRINNEGIAFGLLDDLGSAVIILGAVGFVALLFYFMASGDRERLWLPVGLLAGGAIGNLLDRILLGSVTDFIDPPRWPTFNFADIEITIGVILMVLIFAREEPSDAEPSESSGGEADSPERNGGASGVAEPAEGKRARG